TTNKVGCDADCTGTCTAPAVDCVDDGDVCNGVAICESNVCSQTAPMMQGEACVATSGEDGTCQPQSGSLACVPTGCGNGVVDGNEDCDDGNLVDGDGCQATCTWTCTQDEHCNDNDACTGVETCNVATHTCNAGSPPVCNDNNACTTDSCDAASGCVNTLIDNDGDGHASTSLGACGTDCND